MLRRLSLPLAACGVVLALTACGPSDSAAPAPAGGGTGSTGSDATAAQAEATAPADLCALLEVDEVAAALGGPGELRSAPGGDCQFFADAREGSSALFSAPPLIEGNGGIAGARSGSESVVKGTATDLPGVGQDGYLVVGPGPGTHPSAVAAAVSKGLLVSVNISSSGVDEATAANQATTLIKILVDAL